jgi:hypothetical protein
MHIAGMPKARNLNFQKSKTGLFLTLPSMLDYYHLLTPYMFFRLNHTNPIKPEPKRSISAIVGTKPIFRATQLTPTKGIRLNRTIALGLSLSAIKLAMGGE